MHVCSSTVHSNLIILLNSYTTLMLSKADELDGPAVSALGVRIAEVKQRCSVIGWVTKN
jgi:hypothetical protein